MHAGVQEESTWLLQSLTANSDVLSMQPIDSLARSLQALLAALPGHAANVKVHAPLLIVLGNLAWHNSDLQNMATAAGAIQDAVAALRSSATVVSVHEHWCRVLDVLMYENANAQVPAGWRLAQQQTAAETTVCP
jgi:hypothetical protein